MTMTWIGDNFEHGTFSTQGASIKFGTTKRGTLFNIRLNKIDNNDDGSMFKGSYYFTINVKELKEGSLGIGIVKNDEFNPGWKCRGMFYNGNLTNGSAALLTSFGDFIKCGDDVGILVNRDDGIELVIYLNGRCLGSAFKINNDDGKEYYPCLHMDGNATVDFTFINETSKLPTIRHRQGCNYDDKYSGDWKIKEILSDKELDEYPLNQATNDAVISLDLVKPCHYNLCIKVGNMLRTNMYIIDHNDPFDEVEVKAVMSTMMMPSPEQFELERLLSSSLPTIHKATVSKDKLSNEQLVLKGPAFELLCERYMKQFSPLNTY